MKLKQILSMLFVFILSLEAIAQTKSTNVPPNKPQTLTQKVQTLEKNTQEQIQVIKLDVQTINNSIDEIKKTTMANTTLIQDTTDNTHKQITIWFAVLAGVIAFISIACPLIVNISYQKYYFDKQVKQLQEDVLFIKSNIESTQNNAKAAQTSLNKIEDLDRKLTILQQEVKRSQTKANRAAQRALASKFFAEALAEHKKNPQRAIDLYTKVITLDESNVNAYNNRGVLKKNIGDTEGAMNDYNNAILLAPKDTDVYNNRGILKKLLGDISGAIEDLDKAIELSPMDEEIYVNRGMLKASLGDDAEALADYDKAIEINPNNISAYHRRADLWIKLEKFSKALEDYNKAIEIDPTKAETYNNRADFWLQTQQYEKALEDANYAILLDSSNEINYITRGEINLKKKKYQEAILDFDRALTLKRESVEAYIHRAECYRKLANRSRGKTKKAEYIALAELDDAKINQIKNKDK